MKKAKSTSRRGKRSKKPELIIRMADISKAGYCARGAKRFFQDRDLDFRAFLKDGIDADTLLATGDARALNTVKRKIQRDLSAKDLAGLVITIDDMRESRKCSDGARQLARKAGLDWSAFLAEGISAERLIETGDRDALRVIRDKLDRANG